MKLQNWAADIVELKYKTFLKYLFFDIRGLLEDTKSKNRQHRRNGGFQN